MPKRPNPMFENPGDELEPPLGKPEADSGSVEDRSRPDVSPRAGEYDEQDHETIDRAAQDVIEAKDLRDLTKSEPNEDYVEPDPSEDDADPDES